VADGPHGRLEAVAAGRVQGVGFRWFVRERAQALGLAGWVRNEPDGTVRVVAEGPPAALDALAAALRAGPPGAVVRDLHASRGAATGTFDGFGVDR
jgi:acylphosphatase